MVRGSRVGILILSEQRYQFNSVYFIVSCGSSYKALLRGSPFVGSPDLKP